MAHPEHTHYPLILNLGSGRNFREDCLNVDNRSHWSPDIIADLNFPFPNPNGQPYPTSRFGPLHIHKHSFHTIIAHDVLEHIQQLTVLMKSCLDLLIVGGEFDIVVPYDLSHGAWQDPTHVRAFNERSWPYYTEWFWYLEWDQARFDLIELQFQASQYGKELLAKGQPEAEILKLPRAVDAMHVRLKKILLTEQDQHTYRRMTKREPQVISPPPATSIPSQLPLTSATRLPAAPPKTSFPTAQKQKFAVSIISPPRYTHSAAFQEVAETLHYALLELGYDSVLTQNLDTDLNRKHIILGANLLTSAPFKTPPNSILYNLEQVDLNSPWFQSAHLDLYRQHLIWDCHQLNIEQFATVGITQVRYVPIGYMPQLTRLSNTIPQDIDVLFYGSLNQRRRQIIETLQSQGVKVEVAFNLYGPARDALIERAKIILNIHFYETKLFEIVRASYLLANRKFVISETGRDIVEQTYFSSAVVFAEYEQLVDVCLNYLQRPQDRQQRAERGFSLMSQRLATTYLQPILK